MIRNIALTIVGIGFILVAGLLVWYSQLQLPDFNSFHDRRISNSTKIYDRTGTVVLYDVHGNIKRTAIPLADMGDNIKNATLAIEDSEFYNHGGIRLKSIVRAVIVNTFHIGPKQGGSTITQQVVKNSLLTQDRTITRKIKEWILAIKLDKELTKDQILELYLNDNPYGGTTYGVKEGARTFFNKEPKDLTVAEAAYMAAIPKGPTLYSPYGKNKNLLDERKNTILKRMLDLDIINKDTYTSAKNEIVVFNKQDLKGIKAPHFVFYILDILRQKYGEDAIETGGYNVYTTLDYTLQEKAEEIIAKNADDNEKKYKATNQALVAINPKTGEVLTMVGSKNYFDKTIDGEYNIATAKRQPGSSFKPFVYVTGFEKGYTPETILFDTPTQFNSGCPATDFTSGAPCYSPDNYDNAYKGPMTVRSALQESRNIPAVKMLYLVGIDDAMKKARDIGVTLSGSKDQYGLSLVLGGGEVSLLDMVSGYATLANNGVHQSVIPIIRIEDSNGKVLENYQITTGNQVVTPEADALISNVLSDNNARIPTFGANSSLYVPGYNVAAKTGTTNSNKDAWLIGYTPSIAVGVWSGNNNNTPMKSGGGTVAGPTWNEFMKFVLPTIPKESFPTPPPINETLTPVLRGIWQGGDFYTIDSVSGGLATEYTPIENRVEKHITNVHDILYWVDKNNPTSGIPSNPSSDPLFNHFEVGVQTWWEQHKQNYSSVVIESKPTYYDTIHTAASAPQVTILNGKPFISGKNLVVPYAYQTVKPFKKALLYVNNVLITETTGQPFTVPLDSIKNTDVVNLVKVVVFDTDNNKGQAEAIISF